MAFGVLAGAAVILFVVVLGGATATVATIGQEERALEAEAESATRNAALEVEAAATGNGGQYPGDVLGVIDAAGPWPVDFTVGSSSPEEFCIQATHPELPDRGVLVHYDSDGGGIDGGPCP